RAVLHQVIDRPEESVLWYGVDNYRMEESETNGVFTFPNSGYYVAQEDGIKTFLRCGGYKDRPFQSDNLHLDLWVNGVNYLWDPGSYKYNTDDHLVRFFNGVGGHNTVGIEDADQMLKGGRFIWFYWVKKAL